MHHGPAVELGKDHSIAYKTRLGVILFFVYLFVYAGFVFIGVFYPALMGVSALAGLNLAFVYGMGLIVLAIIMGLVYNYFCTRHEDRMNKEEQV
jgi:uncharacterized membrane protein (DUF485 family)